MKNKKKSIFLSVFLNIKKKTFFICMLMKNMLFHNFRDLYKFFTADFTWPPKWPSVLSLAVHLAVRLCFGRPTSRSKFLAAGLAAKVAALFWPRSDRPGLAAAQHY
ncbi:hypothetical protein BpHYR1_030501 [Brachionus plicatilis]|uniref:Uncharacterized protein n=1 Tax=Brachionus plicatilis TaxID=10195 RepID=A0A3M7R7U8_BRAPC|nr:hypothetical protein BpHYR1_030501 [Brachionus plicatilis]